MDSYKYTNETKDQIFKELRTSALGLSNREAADRLRIYGPNEIKSSENIFWKLIVRQMRSPFFYLLFIAGLVSLFIGERIDSIVIFCFVLVNVVLGFFQEGRAERAVALLKKYVPEKVKAIRASREELVDKRTIVPGDIVMLELGDLAPADLRVIYSDGAAMDESVLSGEGKPVAKTAGTIDKEVKGIYGADNLIFAGSAVASGKATGVVIGTGTATHLGEIADLTATVKRESGYEKDILRFSRIILQVVVYTIIAVFILNLLIKGGENVLSFTIFCIALIVSILPEALPLIATFALSQGALRLAKEHVVVKRLSSIEDLGNISVLCTDKTGTLTENKLTVREIYSADANKCFHFALLGSSLVGSTSQKALNPFDQALFAESTEKDQNILNNSKQLQEITFDHFRLRGDVLVEDNQGDKFFVMRGAPEVILRYCSTVFGKFSKDNILRKFKDEAKKGRRVLGIAYKKISQSKKSISDENEKKLTFLGFISFDDPLKKTAKDTVRMANKLGVKIKILTGDAREAAGEIARSVGLIKDLKQVITGEELSELRRSEFEKACADYAVFARVTPAAKIEILKALQKEQDVGFLGEGVNDAPSLKVASVGIAVKEAADISREVADIVLLRKDLRAVVGGIQEGRNIFSNINKYIRCTLAANFGNFYSIAAISLFVKFIPMLPVQILLVNMLSDFPLITVATDSVDASELKKPKAYRLDKVVGLIISLAIVNSLADLIIFFLFRDQGQSMVQTVWFVEGILTEIALIFAIRTRFAFFRAKAPSLALIALSIITSAVTIILPFTKIGQEAFHLAEPNSFALLAIMVLVGGYFVVSETVKLAYFKFKAKEVIQ
jgi:Mg2+-importing ATPase